MVIDAAKVFSVITATAVAVYISTRGSRAPVEQGGGVPQQEQPKTILEIIGMEDVLSPVKPRGIRNNNPLNIELGDPWQGLAPEQTDGRFAQFIDPRYGYRAAAKILDSYSRRGINTVPGIIATWAPSHENNVDAYINSVSQRSGINRLQTVGPEHYPAILEAMTWHENGQQPYSRELIAEGVSWAHA